MKRISERTKIIYAFRKYARLGLASERLSPFDAYARIRGCSKDEASAAELLAVYETVRFLRLLGREDALRAVDAVYFSLPRRALRKNEISERVLRYAFEQNCDERTVYRKLSYAFDTYKKFLKSL